MDLISPEVWALNRIHFCQDLEKYLQEIFHANRGTFHFKDFQLPTYPGDVFGHAPDRLLSVFYVHHQHFFTRKMARSQASLALARAALHCALFRERTGRWPLDLESISSGQEGPPGIDPFSGHWLRYVPPADGDPTGVPTLYSVSMNGVEDGGAVVLKMKEQGAVGHHPLIYEQGDLVWASKERWKKALERIRDLPPNRVAEVSPSLETSAP